MAKVSEQVNSKCPVIALFNFQHSMPTLCPQTHHL